MLICSACLAGMACKYNGKNNNVDSRVVTLMERGAIIPICPEMLGGLSVPRVPSEMRDDRVINAEGQDVTDAFVLGAKRALALTKGIGATKAILMPRSPSCGIGKIYDGTFEKRLIDGDGLFVRMLKENGIMVYSPESYFMEETNE